MEEKKVKNGRWARWMQRLKTRYRVVVVDDKTFDEKWSVRLTPRFLLLFFGGGAIVIILLTTVLIAYTPLREYIPGYPDGSEDNSLAANIQKVSELEEKQKQHEAYIERLKIIINGGIIPDSINANDTLNSPPDPSSLTKAGEDEKNFRKNIEQKESRYAADDKLKIKSPNGALYFISPVKGVVAQSFNPTKKHYGVDISTATNEPVKAAQSGTVIYAGFTSEGGNEIHIQHTSNIVTIYKHNKTLFRQTGARVKAGETIAIAGNTGELSKGTHLHFEVWENGIAVDPEEMVGF